ncbi:MAG: dCTP deaminase [Methanomicrobiales archaeon]|jgi:dCTP deaminase|nr:dCTP deaminase [Methanomicrobiales archaeon]
MILSAYEITKRLEASESSDRIIISPYKSESQQPASYDLTCATDTILPSGKVTLVPSTEWIELPSDLAATLMCRSTLGRQGVLIGAGFVDPGFRGNLTLCLVNCGEKDISLEAGMRIVQIIFHEVRNNTTLYNGTYQDSHGVVQAVKK